MSDSGFDLILERDVKLNTLRMAISQVFSTPSSDFYIFEDTEDWLKFDLNENIKFVCQVNKVGGEFSWHLQFFIRNSSILTTAKNTSLSLCRILNTKCLRESEFYSEYFVLTYPDGDERIVFVDEISDDNEFTQSSPSYNIIGALDLPVVD